MKINLVKEGNTLYPHTEEDEEKLNKFSNAIYVAEIKNQDLRSIKQNRALHLYCTQIANLLNKQGLYMTGVFGSKIEWSLELVKEQIVKATMKQIFNINSTTKLTKKELDQLLDYVNMAFATKGITLPEFPNRELWEQKQKNGKD